MRYEEKIDRLSVWWGLSVMALEPKLKPDFRLAVGTSFLHGRLIHVVL